MRPGKERPPDFEFEAGARAPETTFRVVGDVGWRIEGVARVNRVRQRDGLPSRVSSTARYRNVNVSTSLKAWLDDHQTQAAAAQPKPPQ